MACREAKLAKRRSIAEVAGSSPVTATKNTYLTVLNFDSILLSFELPSREARQFFTQTFIH